MAFLSLYRKYRPATFDDLVGQEHVVRTLKNALRNDRIAHAYLFAGPRGTGKTSTAKVFAQALNCELGPTENPCGECDVCRKIQSGQSIDVIEIDAASNRGIDEIRDLREKVKFYPSEGQYKVYIIDEVHMLTKGAFNALLKTLEEPPDNVVFILATTEPHKVITTILSRCQRFDFSLLTVADIEARLAYICQQEGTGYEQEALNIIAHSSNGGLRDAISILDQAISYTDGQLNVDLVQEMLGKVDKKLLSQFIRYTVEENTAAALQLVNELIDGGKSVSRFISDLVDHSRQLLLIKECGINSGLLEFPPERLQQLEEESRSVTTGRLIRIIEVLTSVEKELKYAGQPRLSLEMGAVKITSPGVDSSLEGLQARVAQLESRLEKIGQVNFDQLKSGQLEREVQVDQQGQIKQVVNHVEQDKVEQEKLKQEKIEQEKEESSGLIQQSDQRAAEESGEVELDQIRKAWPAILSQLKKEDIKTHAFLIEGKPVQVEGNKIYIQFPGDKSFHRKGAASETALINKIMSKKLNISCQLEFELAGNDRAGEEVADERSAAKNDVTDEVVERVARMFDGKVIKVNQDILEN